MGAHRLARSIAIVSLLALGAAGLAACGSDDDGTGAGPTSSSTTAAPPQERSQRVYFLRGEDLAAAARSLPADAGLDAVLGALLEGPDAFETDIGLGTAIPDGVELLGVDTTGDLATVDLSGAFASGGGSLSMTERVAQVVFTATQDGIERVTITLDGDTVEGIGGEGVPATDVTRADFAEVTPAILVEEPAPGASLDEAFEVRGFASTDGHDVVWNVTDPEGLVVDEGTAAPDGDGFGAWLPFTFPATYEASRDGLGAVIVWWEATAGGPQTDLVEIPVRMTSSGATNDLAGRTFLSTAVQDDGTDRPLVAGTRIRLSFTADRVGATAGCNTMGGDYTLEGTTLRVGELSTTEIGCDAALHDQDEWLAGVLTSDPTVELDGDTLVVSGAGAVITLLDREVADPDRPIVGTRWIVDGVIDGEVVSSVPSGVTASLELHDDGTFEVSPGCNTGGGSARVAGGTITFTGLHLTEMFCTDPGVMDLEDAVVNVLSGEAEFDVEAAVLRLTRGDAGLTLREAGS